MIALWILIGAAAAALFYAVVVERNWFAVRRHTVPCLPPGSATLRILHLSDLHLTRAQRRKQRFLKRLARFEPDIVVGTGDFLGDRHSVDAALDATGAIPARAKYFVLGSNDYFSPVLKNPLRYFFPKRKKHVHGPQNPWREFVDGLRARGWQVIDNQTASFDGIDVVGIGDAHIGLADLGVASARSGDGMRLAVSHSPDVARALASLGYDLIVCGHTHGGQLCIPGIGALVTNCTLPRTMAKGVHRIDGSWLHVCAGLGTSKFSPYRFACRPEVCILELVPRA